MDYIVDLEKFYGPLELLLYLVDKNEMDIYDIPVAEITRQYLAYVEDTGRIDLESLGDFLVMASFLLNLKSRLLLPTRTRTAEEGGDEEILEDPREELVRMLLEYQRYRKAADYLAARQLSTRGRVYFRENSLPAGVEVGEYSASLALLVRTYLQLMQEAAGDELLCVPAGDIDIGEKMVDILEFLGEQQGQGNFEALLERSSSRREAGAFFLALLELVRLNKISALQEDEFGAIDIRLGGEEGWEPS